MFMYGSILSIIVVVFVIMVILSWLVIVPEKQEVIVEMLGKPYNDGMKVSVNFETDESLKEGEQIITGIIKPQINYKGKMIQTAQITVSQNL